jgi:hypothetical protein
MFQHTKTPWEVVQPDSSNPSRAMVAGHGGQVTIYDAPLTEETKRNAALIAAAPDLLNAAMAALSEFDDLAAQGWRPTSGAYGVLVKAVEKAER